VPHQRSAEIRERSESEELEGAHFRAAVEQLSEAVSVFSSIRDESGEIVDFRWSFVNTAASVVTGYASQTLVGRTLLEVLPDHGPSGMLDVYRRVVETGKPYVEPDLSYEDTWGDGRRRRRSFDVRATRLADGFVVVTREVTEEREQATELRRQQEELARTNREMSLLNNASDLLQGCLVSEEAYAVLEEIASELFEETDGALLMYRASRDQLEVKASWGQTTPTANEYEPSACLALRRGKPHVSNASGLRCEHMGEVMEAGLCVPLVGHGDMLGALHLTRRSYHPDASKPCQDLRSLAIAVAGQLSMALANLRLRDTLRDLAVRDHLTGLFNRRYLDDTLSRELGLAERNGSAVSVVAIDIDHFKTFNDEHGHDVGDAVMQAVADVLRQSCRISDIACRLGGEEFLVVLGGCPPVDAHARAEQIRLAVRELRVSHGSGQVSGVTISLGVASYPAHATTAGALLKCADAAMYDAKRAGRDRVLVSAA
jgi:diguanylate cyclase (GGDEF)-like protein/PAS domain S-box-containing protein